MSANIDSTSTPQTKQCTKCGTVYDRPAESFSKNARNKDGLENRCRECKSTYTRDRYANDPECRARQLASGRKWRENNPSKYLECNVNYRAKNQAKCRETWRLYRVKNRAACRERTHRWYLSHTKEVCETKKKYRLDHPDKMRANKHKYRARQQTAEGANLPFDEKAQLKHQHGKCYYCQCKLDKYHIDHVIPLSRGGSDHPDNKVLSCPHCNQTKSAKLPHEWSKGGRLL